ncbi:MAG: hypothetical protein CL908_26550 [Deltaproteobacteria bacterium]|jgi:hypothetical protein|nr:hypothetical protein [Deltaproteobacteria bacterium]
MARGDHIFVERLNGFYSHHGIDCGDGTVIHYNGPDPIRSRVHRCPMEQFHRGDDLQVRQPETETKWGAHGGLADVVVGLTDSLTGRRLENADTSPDSIVARAESRLGEGGFDFLFNNCEHFASWCRTGSSRSTQSETLFWPVLGALKILPSLD